MTEAMVSIQERTTIFSNMRYENFFLLGRTFCANVALLSLQPQGDSEDAGVGQGLKKKEAQDWKRDCSSS